MRRFTRLALAALAAIGASGALVAAPAASWVNFGGGITNGSTTTHYGSTVNTATVTGGTWNAEGGYLQLGDATTPTPTDGTITLQLPATITSATAITVMLDVAGLPTGAASLITVALSNSTPSACLNTTSTELQQVTGGGLHGKYEYGQASRSPRQMIAFAYNSGVGTNTIIDGVQRITNTGLKYENRTPTAVTIGAVRGLKVYGIYLYDSQLSAAQVATETAIVRGTVQAAVSVSMTRNDAANNNSIKVATLRKGATSTVTNFTATFGSSVENATAARNSANTDGEATTFFKDSWSSCANVNVKDGYPMVCNKFLNANSDYYWRLWVPITLETTDTFNDVLPELYPTTSGGEDQGAAATFFNYTISLYEGTVTKGTTAEPIATATGTTNSTLGINTNHATLSAAISGRSGVHTLKIEVTPKACGNGAYSGIRSVQFFNRTTASRTVSGTEGTWSAGWPEGTSVYGADVTLNVSDAATLSMDTSASLSSLMVNDSSTEEVTPSLTFTGTNSLSSATTTLNVNTDVSAITASLGAVTLAGGKTLTVKSLTQTASLSTSDATLVTTGDTALASGSTLLNGVTNLIVRGGTFSSSLSGGSALATERNITVTGTGTNLLLEVGDGTGWNSEVRGIRVENGGTLTFGKRDTLKTPITLCGGTMTFGASAAGTSGRALDFFNGNGNVVTVEAAGTGSVEAPTTSSITVAGTGDNAKLAIRNGTLTFNVADRAKLVVSGSLISRYNDGGTPNAVTKSGDGVLELTAANTFDTGLTISGGRVLVTGDGTLGTGTVTVNEGKTLEVQVADSATKTIANTLSGAGTVKKSGTGTLSLTGTVSTPVEVAAGTLKLGASVTSTSVTVSGGVLEMGLPSSARTVTANGGEGKLVLRLTESEAAAESLPTQLSWTGDVSQVEVHNSDGALLARTVSKDDESNRLVLTVGEASTRTWRTGASSWASGLPDFALGDSVTFGSNAASETVVVPSKTTVGKMNVAGQYAFTVAPGGLTASQMTVSGTAKFNRLTVNYVRLTASNTNESGNAPALAELLLTKDGKVVPWPRGTTISQLNSDGRTTPPNWTAGGNEAVNALIDGVWQGQPNYTNPDTNGGTGTYTGGAGNNKWWPTADPAAYAVIHLGAAIDFDGYQLRTADYNPRSPRDWSLEVSADGTTWFVADRRANQTTPATHSLYVYERSNTVFPLPATIAAPITVGSSGTLGGDACVAGNVTFEAGATLDATGATPLEVTGTVTASGTVTVVLPEGTVLQRVLTTATTGLESAFSAAGYTFSYRDGAYWATLEAAKSLTATVTEDSRLTDLIWTRTDNGDEIDAATREHLFALPDVTATLTTTSAAAVTINCVTVPALKLSGTAVLTLSAANGVSPTIASLTVEASAVTLNGPLGTVTVEGEVAKSTFSAPITVASDSTLTLNSTVPMTLSSAITGEGKLVIGDGTATQVTQAAVGCDISAIDIAAGATYTVSTAGDSSHIMLPATTTVTIAENGKLCINTVREMDANVTGAGEVEIAAAATYVFKENQTNCLAPGKLTVKSGLTLQANRADTGLSVKELVFAGGTLTSKSSNEIAKPVVTVANGQELSGYGAIAAPIVFEAGAIFDAKDSAVGSSLKLTNKDKEGNENTTITWPKNGGKVTVRATEPVQLILFAAAGQSEHFTLEDSAITQGLYLSEAKGSFGTDLTMSVLKRLGTEFLPTEVSGNATMKTAIQGQIEALAGKGVIITQVTTLKTQNTAEEAMGSAQAVNCFTNLEPTLVLTPNWNGGGGYSTTATATVTYDFGIADMTIRDLTLTGDTEATRYVLLAAKVQNSASSNTADFAEGVKLTVMNGDTEITPTEVTAAVATGVANAAETTGVQWLAVPLKTLFPDNAPTGTQALKVKVSKTTPAN